MSTSRCMIVKILFRFIVISLLYMLFVINPSVMLISRETRSIKNMKPLSALTTRGQCRDCV